MNIYMSGAVAGLLVVLSSMASAQAGGAPARAGTDVHPADGKADAVTAPAPKVSPELMRRAVVDGKIVQRSALPGAERADQPGSPRPVESGLTAGQNGRARGISDVQAGGSVRAMIAFMLSQAKSENQADAAKVSQAINSSDYVRIKNDAARCVEPSVIERLCVLEAVVFKDGELGAANKKIPVAFRDAQNSPWRVAIAEGDDAGVRNLITKIINGESLMAPDADKTRATPPEHLPANRPARAPDSTRKQPTRP